MIHPQDQKSLSYITGFDRWLLSEVSVLFPGKPASSNLNRVETSKWQVFFLKQFFQLSGGIFLTKKTYPASVKIPLKPRFPLHLRVVTLDPGSNPTGDVRCLNDLKKKPSWWLFFTSAIWKRCASRQIGSWNPKVRDEKQQNIWKTTN